MRLCLVVCMVVFGCAEADNGQSADARASTDARANPDSRELADAAAASDAMAAADAAASADADVAADASLAADAAAGADGAGGSDGGVIAYSHTIAIDGTNDFNSSDERFTTTTAAFFTYVAWDSQYLYVGVEGADVGSGSATRWVLIYLGGTGGTTDGQSYNTQQPTLPFSARYHVRWRADNNLTEAQEYTTAWTPLSWDFTGDVFQTGSYLEMRIPLADIGNPTQLPVHINLINEQGGGEWTFAGTPSTSFTDGYDQNYSAYYDFAIGGGLVPTAHAAQ